MLIKFRQLQIGILVSDALFWFKRFLVWIMLKPRLVWLALIVIIAFFFAISEGGIFSLTLPVTEVVINLSVDISTILLMIVSVNLFDIAKNLLEAINILTQKATDIDFT